MPYDVNDPALRDTFLRTGFSAALAGLAESSVAGWGRMGPQEMVEHLIWALEVSTGRVTVACHTPAEELPRLKRFLLSNRPSPREFMNPALTGELPPLRHPSLPAAKAALEAALSGFLDRPSEGLQTHPVFGPLSHEEWHRMHYKHFHHHLEQFGLGAGG